MGRHLILPHLFELVPRDDPRPFSHAYFPRRAFDEVAQRGGWTFGRKGNGYIALYSQHPARWSDQEPYADVELRADAQDNIWICEMGNAQHYRSFGRFVDAISSATVECDGLRVHYGSPSLGAVSFGWTEPLRVGTQEVQLHDYRRFDNPYCQVELGDCRYVITSGEDQLVLDFC